jgi:hypothetical protein
LENILEVFSNIIFLKQFLVEVWKESQKLGSKREIIRDKGAQERKEKVMSSLAAGVAFPSVLLRLPP